MITPITGAFSELYINMTLTLQMNTHTLNTRPSRYVKQKLIELKAEVDNSTIIIGDLNIPLSIMIEQPDGR